MFCMTAHLNILVVYCTYLHQVRIISLIAVANLAVMYKCNVIKWCKLEEKKANMMLANVL